MGYEALVGSSEQNVASDELLTIGDSAEGVLVVSTAAIGVDVELAGVILGGDAGSDHPGTAAKSLLIANTFADGDIMLAVQSGGDTTMSMLMDASAGSLALQGLTLDVSSTGDPQLRLTIPGGTSWYAGVDNSGSDIFYLGTGTTVGTAGSLRLDGTASGAAGVTQNAFSARAVSLADSGSARLTTLSISGRTATMAGTSTSSSIYFADFGIDGMTVSESGGAVQVAETHGMYIYPPRPREDVTIVQSNGLEIRNPSAPGESGATTTLNGINIEVLTRGGTDHGINFEGAMSAGNIYSAGHMYIETVGASNILMGDGTDLLRLNGNDTIDMLPGGGTIGMRTGASNNYGVIVGGSMTAGTTDSLSAAFAIGTALTGASGDTSWLTLCQVDGSIVTQTATESIGHVSALMVDEPNITDSGLTGDITVAASIYIRGVSGKGLTNAAIAIAAGDIKFLGSTDSASVADQVAIGGYEVGVGDRVLAISSEADVASDTSSSLSHKLKVRINGATYYLMLTS